ncbi:small multidrug efflux protein [Microbacterium sp. NPDC076768]|uniref:small multidrug efflux protein n=1 Tax=Microbacterium sp. NPDC076768 TaxID=3154858 RepID=UPI003442E9FC
MNLIENFQNLVAQVPELVQPLVVALAGAVPFIEGEGAASIGIIGGISPVIAVIAAIVGNFVCVAVLVTLSSGARAAVVNRTKAKQLALAGGIATDVEVEPAPHTPTSARHQKFQRALERYGVPGVSLLGPLLLPTQFTATTLAAMGISKARVLFWQALAIIGWTSIIAFVIENALLPIS